MIENASKRPQSKIPISSPTTMVALTRQCRRTSDYIGDFIKTAIVLPNQFQEPTCPRPCAANQRLAHERVIRPVDLDIERYGCTQHNRRYHCNYSVVLR